MEVERSVSNELARTAAIMQRFGFELRLADPNSADTLAAAEDRIGIEFDRHVREYFLACDGSFRHLSVAVMTDEITPCRLPSLRECLSWWEEWLPYDQGIHDQLGLPESCDPRIRNQIVHRLWFPLAEFNGWSTSVFFDADPVSPGERGQIIAYQHDPDGMYFVAANFAEFLATSNDHLEAHGRELLFVDGQPAVDAPPRSGAS
jgi:cell wall assembly regulator SMI1